jgi:hypothetical protein
MLLRKKYYHLNKIGKITEQYDAHFRKYAVSRSREETGKREEIYEGYKNVHVTMTTVFHGRYPLNKTLR